LNDRLQEAGQLDRFVTFGACVLDLAQHTVTVASAGHPPPLIYRAATQAYENGCTTDQGGFPLGIVSDVAFECATFPLAPGDCVILYTDGLSESQSVADKDFGNDGILAALGPSEKSPKMMGTSLVDAVHQHAAGRKPHDDLTVVTFGRLL
jgi:sigma-B regulation protein RsbU (phosphoserine phosphatase)